ncbi:hypothetical protein ACOMHN_031125 [Nucella lapillus]
MGGYGAIFFFCAWVLASTNGQCTFPSSLQGTWLTSSLGNITIATSTIDNYPVGLYGDFEFDCNQEYDDRYIAKSQTLLSTSGLTLYIYLCFDFTMVSSNLYYYYLASRDGAAARQSCPSDVQASWSYEVDSGSGNTCSPGGQLEAGTDTEMTANYTACATPVFYSTSGQVYCLVSITSGSSTYLTVYNTDTAVDSSNTYRMACLVFEKSGSSVSMSQYPEVCQSSQTPTTVSTPTGSLLTLTTAATTIPSESSLLCVVLGVVVGMVALCVAVISIFVLCNWKAKQKPFRGKLEPEEPGDKPSRLKAFENGFKRIKHPGELDRPLDREGTPEHDEDTPINVMQLLRKDIITPGGRESPASHVILSVSTPNPYCFHDGDSVGGGSLPIPHENPALKKHYHVIGGEPSVGELGEQDEDNLSGDADGFPITAFTKSPARVGSGRRLGSGRRVGSGRKAPGSARSVHTPVMVMPVRSDGSDAFDGDGDDVSDDALFESDAESALAAARLGVGIDEFGMGPPPRLPPIDEGPASHR